MPWISTDQLTPGEPSPLDRSIYNGLDCCITFEVLDALKRSHPQAGADPIYQFERALQAPLLEMMLRGIKVDELERRRVIEEMERQLRSLDLILQQFADAVWGKPLNPNSPKQKLDFFYEALRLPKVFIYEKGKKKLSTNRDTLEKLQVYLHARPIISVMLRMGEISKELQQLKMGVDSDGRMRTSLNITTETGRLSSSKSATGSGGNLQNLKADAADGGVQIRRIFTADQGYVIFGPDLEQAESREVGWLMWTLFGDRRYLDACYAGDLHTITARLIWPKLPWNGDLKKDRAIAERPFYRHFSYRDMSKRGGHAYNYYATPFTVSKHLKIPQAMAEEFGEKYLEAYGLRRWHKWVAVELQTKRAITTPLGRTRHFFGRPGEDATLREAIAYSPQSSTADRMNLGMWRVWKELGGTVQLLLQVHDAIYFQAPQSEDLQAIAARAMELIDVKLPPHNGVGLSVPANMKAGWNLSNYHERLNPNGLRKWTGRLDRVRAEGINRIL